MKSSRFIDGRDLSEKNIAFVGGSGGIGLEAATPMARLSVEILIVGHNRKMAERGPHRLRNSDDVGRSGSRRTSRRSRECAAPPTGYGLGNPSSTDWSAWRRWSSIRRPLPPPASRPTLDDILRVPRDQRAPLGRLAASGDGRIVSMSWKTLQAIGADEKAKPTRPRRLSL